MSEPVAILCRIKRTHIYRNYKLMIEILPIGEKERGEKPDEMCAEELQEQDIGHETEARS